MFLPELPWVSLWCFTGFLKPVAGLRCRHTLSGFFHFKEVSHEPEHKHHKETQGNSGNGLQKTCKTPYLALYTIIYFFLIFSVAFVAGERKSLVQQGLLRDLPGNGVGNGIATSHATGAAFSERKLHLTEFFIGQLTKTVSKIPVRC